MRQSGGQPLTQEHLLSRAECLIVDFHGLPKQWDRGPRADHFRRALSLQPALNAAKRGQAISEDRLRKPGFSYALTYWEELSDALLPAELRDHLADCDLLCLVPHGPLHSLPFAALHWSAEEYLIERFGLCHAQSAAVLRHCQAKNRRRTAGAPGRPDSCFIAAVAAPDDEQPQDFEADGDTLATLFDARQARLTRLVGAAGRDGDRPASKELIRRTIAGHAVVHLACHGIFGLEGTSGDPLDSGLLVSDGRATLTLAALTELGPAQWAPYVLTAREVFELQLNADLVTLRACSSGRAEVRSGDELIGLTRAFLYAGAPSLLVSLWNVNKRSSQRLLNEFYRLWLDEQRPLPKWRALQLAQQQLLRDPQYRHPYHWAPFILLGDWL